MAHIPLAAHSEISRSRLCGNFHRLRSLLPATSPGATCDLLAVVKGNAYGHGVALCAPWLAECGAKWLGVTSVSEGAEVRRLCPETNILVMRGLLRGEADELLEAQLTPTVWTPEQLDWLTAAARRRDCKANSVPVHLEVDTGMLRQGVAYPSDGFSRFLERLVAAQNSRLDGVYTHFASPEVPAAEQNQRQLCRFKEAVAGIAAAGLRPRWVHAGNSSTLLGVDTLEDLARLAASVGATLLVRPGIALYGYVLPFDRPGAATRPLPTHLEPVMTLKTVVASIRTAEPGALVGYSGSFTASRPMRLGLLPIGYADGINRRLSNRGHVLIHGKAAAIVGRVSMDLTIVDLTEISGAAPGDEAVVLGEQGGLRITADDHARWADTIAYEILCAVGARVPRVPVA